MRRIGLAALLASGSLFSCPALAQTASPTQASTGSAVDTTDPQQDGPSVPAADAAAPEGGDIVVTAQKRSQRLQDVPIAVTAVTSEQLANRQINDTTALVQAVPALSYQANFNVTNSSFRVRGVGTSLFSQGVEPSVSVVVDGVVSARQVQSFADFADIERIEVLRGPQGTLFGKNSTAGVINIVTARPSSSFDLRGDVTVAEMDEYRAKMAGSGPITDTLRAGVSGYYNNVGGIYRNVTTGRERGGEEGFGVRGKLDWDATPNLNLLLIGDYRKNDIECCRTVLVRTDNPVLASLYRPVVASFRNRSIAENADTGQKLDQTTVSLQADWDLGGATVTSITAYQNFFTSNTLDNDGFNTTVPIFTGGGTNPAQYDYQVGSVALDNVTQELRIGSSGSRRFTYVAGVYYSHVLLDRDFERRRTLCARGTIGQPCAVTAQTFQSAGSRAHVKSDSISAFGQAEYELVSRLRLIGGLRLLHEFIGVEGDRYAPLVVGDQVFPASFPVSGYRTARDTALTGKAGLQFEASRNAQFYGSYTRGYKGKGFDTEITADFANQQAVQPETVNAYEIGAKGRTADNSFSFALAAFRSDYSNLQIQANRSNPDTGVAAYITTNAGSSRTQGVELEATLRPSRAFSMTSAVSYTDTSADVDGLNCPLQFQAAAPILTGGFPVNACYRARTTLANGTTVTSGPIQNIRGGTLPVAPKWRIVLSPRVEQPIGGTGLEGFLQVNLNFQSKVQYAIEQDPLLTQQAYALVDASAGIEAADGRYRLTFFVRNLFDTNYYTQLAHGGSLATTASPNDLYALFNRDSKRYLGAQLGFRF